MSKTNQNNKTMSVTRSIKVEGRKRTGTGVLSAMRREGWVPSVIYGTKTENKNIKVPSKAFGDILNAAPSAKILINLEQEDGTTQVAFIQDLQHDPLTGQILHADFLAVDPESEIRAALPLVLVGEPIGVKVGGALEQTIYKLAIKAKVKDLPEFIEVNVKHLNVAESLRIGDIKFPDGVFPTLNEKVVVALVAKTRAAQSAAK
jgi:large subunit ribosomal protein L25